MIVIKRCCLILTRSKEASMRGMMEVIRRDLLPKRIRILIMVKKIMMLLKKMQVRAGFGALKAR